jgi:hypothetical protein
MDNDDRTPAIEQPTMQMMPEPSKVMFVAVEYGRQWPADLSPNPGTDLIVVAQIVGEDLLVFARRFLDKVLSFVARGAQVTSVVLAVAPSFDLRHLEARCLIARALLRHHGSCPKRIACPILGT